MSSSHAAFSPSALTSFASVSGARLFQMSAVRAYAMSHIRVASPSPTSRLPMEGMLDSSRPSARRKLDGSNWNAPALR